MRLKQIRIVGFKSFADETIIDLKHGFTCIVGPNGCGKSNILDALRWVLGEKSAKMLRGKQMEDVIFIGSEQRKSAGMTEVEITFDNKERVLDPNKDEVTVGRRLYLSSISEYYLNGTRTTRKAVEKIFMDTGIGKTAYSIMEQGKISEILRSTPESKRLLIDEAAGISRFKTERQETMQRLQETEQNLLRLQDILRTHQKEIDHLAKQALKTKRYLTLKDKLDTHDCKIRFLCIKNLQEKSKAADEKLSGLIEEREGILKKTQNMETIKDKMEKDNQHRIEQSYSLEKRFHQDISQIKLLSAKKKHLGTEKKERLNRIQEFHQQASEEQKKHSSLEKKYSQSSQIQLNLKTDLSFLKEKNKVLGNQIHGLREEIQYTIEQEEKGLVSIQKEENEHESLFQDLKNVTHDLIVELERKKKELESREEYRGNLRKSIREKLQKIATIKKEVLDLIQKKEIENSLSLLHSMDPEYLQEEFQRYESVQQEFHAFLFEGSGLLIQKENLDQKMAKISTKISFHKKEILQLKKRREDYLNQLNTKKNERMEIDLKIRDFEVRSESFTENCESLKAQINDTVQRLSYYKKQQNDLKERLKEINEEEERAHQEISSIEGQKSGQSEQIEALRVAIERKKQELEGVGLKIQGFREDLEEILPSISKRERADEELRVQLKQQRESLYNDFQFRWKDLEEKYKDSQLNEKEESEGFRTIQKEIRELGSFNALAVDELQESEEKLSLLEEQKNDVEESHKNLLQVLKEVEKKSRDMFEETFVQVQKELEKVFQSMFGGGKAELSLTEPSDPLKSGVEIMVQPPGKKHTSIALLSGGEQSMTAISLMFALYLIRPSPFCFLDEIDAPLDDHNVKRFMKMLADFSTSIQFLIITHNKLTMAHADSVFGVTQQEAGVSKIVSVDLSQKKIA